MFLYVPALNKYRDSERLLLKKSSRSCVSGREQLSIAAQEAWLEFLALFSEGCSRYRQAVHCIATLDCLFSLAAVAKQPGFVR